MRLSGLVSADRGWVHARLLAALLLFGAALFHTAAAAQEEETCEFSDEDDPDAEPVDTEGCLSQEGDNLAGSNGDFNGGGGDGVGGSNVIGGAGTGRTRIQADNTSEFSDAKGGSTESESHTSIDNGPKLSVEGGNTTIVAEATGISTVNQVAAPTVSITLEQVAEATGLSTFSNTASSSTSLTGANVLGQSIVSPTGSTGISPVTQTINQTASSSVSNTFAPVVNTVTTNTAAITASAPVTQLGTAISNPVAIATPGPGVSAAAAASGSAVVAQSATPSFVFGTSQSTSQTAPSFSNTAVIRTTLNARNSATGAPLGPVVQTIIQNASSPSATLDALNLIVATGPGVAPFTQIIVQNADGSLTNVFSPTITGTNASTLTTSGSSPVLQSANAVSNPTSTVGP